MIPFLFPILTHHELYLRHELLQIAVSGVFFAPGRLEWIPQDQGIDI